MLTVKTRPILQLFDGHVTHLSAATVELALAENVSLVKLPAHCTDVLHPLDVSCFSPLKVHYEKFLTEFVHRTGGRQKLTKPAFCNLIASIWRKGLTSENIKSGFQSTGTFPVDETRYKQSRLDKVKLATYTKWRGEGSPVDSEGSPIINTEEKDKVTVNDCEIETSSSSLTVAINASVSTVKSPGKKSRPKLPFSERSYIDNLNTTPVLQDNPGPSCSTPVLPSKMMSQEEILEMLQNNAPAGYKYCLTLVPRETDSLEKVLKNRMVTKNDTAESAPPPKRHKISMHAAVITNSEYQAKIAEKAKG